MVTILIKAALEPEGFRAVAAGGQLRSDLLQVVGVNADRCRFWRDRPAAPLAPGSGEERALTSAMLDGFSKNCSGRWDFYGVQLYAGEKLLLSVGRWGTELMLFGLAGEPAKALLTLIEEYDEVALARAFPEPLEVLARCAKRVV